MSNTVAFQFGQLARNLIAGVRLALFLPLRAEAFRASPVQFALLALFNFAVWAAAAGARDGFQGEFQPTSIAAYLANVALVLATALLVAHAYRTPERLLLVAVALSASDALFDLTALVLALTGVMDLQPTLLYVAYVAWAWIVSLRAAAICGAWARPGLYLAAIVVTAMTATALYVIPEAEIWQLPEDEEGELEASRLQMSAGAALAANLITLEEPTGGP